MTVSPSKNRTYHYEAMFLVSPAEAADLNSIVEHMMHLITHGGGTVIAFSKWDDRRLAFEVKKNKRGVYFLCYFSIDSVRLPEVERNCNLSERLLRILITKADHLSLEEMLATEGREKLRIEAELRKTEQAAAPAPTPAAQPAEASA
jgi:small subunit ribosomal protein S6